VRYCTRCILPDTRPGLELDAEGVCSACRSHDTKTAEIDWDERRATFERAVESAKAQGREYDAVVPVSGGKDSTWQVATCLEHGLRVLAVTWKTPARTEIGARNLKNLIGLGVDHVDFTINPHVERRFLLESLTRHGTTAIPMHLAIFNVPLATALRYRAPLVVWGENSALEYIGQVAESGSFELTREWIRKYGAVHGTSAEDWVSDDLPARDLSPYTGPSDADLRDAGVRAIFLGMFFPWDPQAVYDFSRARGFVADPSGPRMGTYDYADIDDDFHSIHHALKWLKFGFTRDWDNLSLEIRNGRLTRGEAIERVRELGDRMPYDDIRKFCDYVGITEQRFFEIVEPFRNRDIWRFEGGVWRIEEFLIPDWNW
jgi:N-acetyl sugar amidotransferase